MKKNSLLNLRTEMVLHNLEQKELSDRRVSGRTKQLNIPVKPLFHQKLKSLAVSEKRTMAAVLEDALERYTSQ